jgi:hypothetical protein
MKKLLLILLLAALTLGLTACGGQGAAVTGDGYEVGEEGREVIAAKEEAEAEMNWWTPQPRTADFTKLTIMPDPASGESLLLPDMWVTANGAYYVNTTSEQQSSIMQGGRGGGMVVSETVSVDRGMGGMDEWKQTTLVHIIDSATGRDMVLCNRVTCPHDSEDCGAYLPDDPSDPDDFMSWGWGGYWGGSNILFVDGEYIYALNSGNTFYRLGLDGSGRTEHMRLPDKYDLSWSQNWLMNGNLYMLASIMIPHDEWGFTTVQAMIEVNYRDKTVTEIWVAEPWSEDGDNAHINVMGLWDGQIYVCEMIYPQWGPGEDAMLDYYNNQQITMYSYDPANGQRTDIFNDTSYGFNGNTWNIPESGEIFFHSRRDATLNSLNVKTGVVTVLATGVEGFLFIQEERDGRVSMMRYDNDDWMTTYDPVQISMLFYDIATGEFGEMTLRTRLVGYDGQETEIIYILFEEDGYYYIEIEREYEEHSEPPWGSWLQQVSTLLGRIPIDDYWASNEDALEELDRYEMDDWWEFLSERQGWGGGSWARG